MVTLAEQTVEYLEFFYRWDTPLSDRAAMCFSRLVRGSPDFATFQTLAPDGSEERALFERHLGSFEEAGRLIRDGQMRSDLFFDAWYVMPGSWLRAKPFVLGMRDERAAPELYTHFEWLAQQAVTFWAEREQHPPTWQPLRHDPPTPADQAIYGAFQRIWSTERDETARLFFAALERDRPPVEEFLRMVSPGSEAFITFDRLFCAYDQAGTLIKNAVLHPTLFFSSWRSPAALWATAADWVLALRRDRQVPHLYDNVDWLVDFERQRDSGG